MKLIIYSTDISKRLTYISQFIFEQVLGTSCDWTSDKSFFINYEGAKINYSNQTLKTKCLSIPKHAFLDHPKIEPWDINVSTKFDFPCFFQSPLNGHTLDFDLFSMAFFMVSRYEEYLPFKSDQHHRFPASESLAYQNNFLHLPIIDLWAYKIKALLLVQFPNLSFSPPSFSMLPTIDIDMAWSYRNKGFLRTIGAYLKDFSKGNIQQNIQRFKVQTGLLHDPFDSFHYMEKLHAKFQLKPLYFWLLGQYGAFDKNSASDNSEFQHLIKQVSKNATAGIHPSYASNEQKDQSEKEKQALEIIVETPVYKSRQHFLRLSFPDTYRTLIKNGIKEDYTMGFASAIGFRAGTAHPFYWYDLLKEETTKLKVFPFQAMDVTLQQYLNYTPKEALEKIKPLIAMIQQTNGLFISLWHNSSFTEQENWKGWKKVYESILAYSAERK